MSVPMIRALKSGNAFKSFPSGFYKPLIDILVFSFGDDLRSFEDIIKKLRSTFSKCFEHIKRTVFINLLDNLVARMQAFDRKLFKNQIIVNKFLTEVLDMIENN